MKIYRCVIGCLLVFFLVISVWYMVSCINEQRSTDGGTLIYHLNGQEETVKGVEEIVTANRLC